jgi:hypothetical protein
VECGPHTVVSPHRFKIEVPIMLLQFILLGSLLSIVATIATVHDYNIAYTIDFILNLLDVCLIPC